MVKGIRQGEKPGVSFIKSMKTLKCVSLHHHREYQKGLSSGGSGFSGKKIGIALFLPDQLLHPRHHFIFFFEHALVEGDFFFV